MKRVLKITLLILLPLLVSLFVAALIALPFGLKKYINEHGQEFTGRKTSVQHIQIGYFPATFNAIGFEMKEADGTTPFVSFDTLTVVLHPWKLISAELVIEKIRLVKPEVQIVRKGTAFNFDDILAFLEAKSKADSSATPGQSEKPFSYFLRNISMEHGKLTFEDKNVVHKSVLNDLGFTIPSLSFNQKEIKDAGVKFNFENGGSFQANSEFNQESGSYKADFYFQKLDISPFLPYAREYFHLSGLKGLIGGNFHLEGNLNDLNALLLSGKGKVDEFAAKDDKGTKVLALKTGEVTMLDSYPMKFDFRFGEINMTEPFLLVEMKDSTINLLNLMVESPEDTIPFTYAYQINRFRITEGLLDLRDNSYESPFDYHLSSIDMKVDSISSSAKWLNAFASMRLNKRGKLQAELGINPSDPYELKVNYVITNFQLSDLNIYSTHFVGYPFLLGNMYYKGNTVIANKQLNSENKLIIRNAQLGKKSGGLMDLPMKLALYLLKDIHGDIILDLPVTGDLNDPKTKIGRLVWQVVKNVIVKVVASPFLAIGKMMGVEPSEAKGLDFAYADTTLTAKQLKRIKLYTEIEQKKPDMKVELSYFNDAALEKQEIARIEAEKIFRSATGTEASKEMAKFKSFLAEKLQNDSIKMENAVVKLIGDHKLDSIQTKISQIRIDKIEAALRSFSDSTKIRVVTPDKRAPEHVGSRPVFELKYSVEE